MNINQLRKEHRELARLFIDYKLKYGGDPVPRKDKNYILSIVNDSRRCFSIIEYNDGWTADSKDGKVQDINIPSREILSYQSEPEKNISENNFISLLMELIRIYSNEDQNNQLLACFRTNGAGGIILDAISTEIREESLDVKIFPTARRSKTGKELFNRVGRGWEMTVAHEKDCLDAMKTAQEQGYFTLATDRSKGMFELTSVDEQNGIEPFMYVWMMLSFVRLSSMNLF